MKDHEFSVSSTGYSLVLSRGEDKGKVFPLEPGDNLVGRWDPEAGSFPEVDLESFDPEAKVSRKHAVVRVRGDELSVEDIGSMNGVFVNRGNRIEKGVQCTLKPGDEIIIGKTFLRLEKAS